MQDIIKYILLKIRSAENMKEEEIERIVDKILAEGKLDREMITTTEIRKAIKKMKNKKAGDKNNGKAEWIKESGDGMVHRLATLFNRVEEENKIPMQWGKTKIKSTYKEGNKKSKRDFLVTIVCCTALFCNPSHFEIPSHFVIHFFLKFFRTL